MIDGIINVYKESGYTSHDVVAKLRGILKQKKIGHTGTLDPEAQGVLPVCLGKATKVCDLLTDRRKTYQAVMVLGVSTDTQDMTGTVIEERPVTCSESDVRTCIRRFVGDQEQIPPMYSALKVNGKKLYELARQGIEVERRSRRITVYEISIEQVSLPEVVMTVTCSKGTYIRTLCHDIGEALGCGGCMKSLLRTKVGPFELPDSLRLDEIEALRDDGKLDTAVRTTDSVFEGLRMLILSAESERFVRNGNPLNIQLLRGCVFGDCGQYPALQRETDGRSEIMSGDDVQTPGFPEEENRESSSASYPENRAFRKFPDGTQFRVYSADGSFLAVYQWMEQRHCCRPVKMFL